MFLEEAQLLINLCCFDLVFVDDEGCVCEALIGVIELIVWVVVIGVGM